jgi:CheY-like chemotaxis protein
MALRPASSAPGRSRILVVDDDEHVREVVEMVLEGLGHSVTSTASGFEALHVLEETHHDVAIIDLRIPDLDGPTLYQEILARWPADGPRVLFVSGFACATSHDGWLRSRDVPILLKPFTLEELSDSVGRLLATI